MTLVALSMNGGVERWTCRSEAKRSRRAVVRLWRNRNLETFRLVLSVLLRSFHARSRRGEVRTQATCCYPCQGSQPQRGDRFGTCRS
jgi:hypothetical protein